MTRKPFRLLLHVLFIVCVDLCSSGGGGGIFTPLVAASSNDSAVPTTNDILCVIDGTLSAATPFASSPSSSPWVSTFVPPPPQRLQVAAACQNRHDELPRYCQQGFGVVALRRLYFWSLDITWEKLSPPPYRPTSETSSSTMRRLSSALISQPQHIPNNQTEILHCLQRQDLCASSLEVTRLWWQQRQRRTPLDTGGGADCRQQVHSPTSPSLTATFTITPTSRSECRILQSHWRRIWQTCLALPLPPPPPVLRRTYTSFSLCLLAFAVLSLPFCKVWSLFYQSDLICVGSLAILLFGSWTFLFMVDHP